MKPFDLPRTVLSIGALVVGTCAAAPSFGQAADASALAEKNLCLSCHAVDKRVVGPSFREIAAKYRGDAGAAAKLADKVRKGGKGVWGAIPMPPNKDVSDEDLRTLVAWVLSLEK